MPVAMVVGAHPAVVGDDPLRGRQEQHQRVLGGRLGVVVEVVDDHVGELGLKRAVTHDSDEIALVVLDVVGVVAHEDLAHAELLVDVEVVGGVEAEVASAREDGREADGVDT